MIVSENKFHIPTVDISPYLKDPSSTESLKIIDQVHEACITTGFFQLVGHGISPEIQADVFKGSATFFSLPVEEKNKLDKSSSGGAANHGYEIIGTQGLQEGTLPDLKEVSYTDINNTAITQMKYRASTSVNIFPPTTLALKPTPTLWDPTSGPSLSLVKYFKPLWKYTTLKCSSSHFLF